MFVEIKLEVVEFGDALYGFSQNFQFGVALVIMNLRVAVD